MVFTCSKCGVAFPTNQKLQRHLARKRPCDPILDRESLPEAQRNNPNRCQFCGRAYSRPDSLKRHYGTCILADDAPLGAEHALKRQQERFEKELAKRDAAIAKVTARLELLAASAAVPQDASRVVADSGCPRAEGPSVAAVGEDAAHTLDFIQRPYIEVYFEAPRHTHPRLFAETPDYAVCVEEPRLQSSSDVAHEITTAHPFRMTVTEDGVQSFGPAIARPKTFHANNELACVVRDGTINLSRRLIVKNVRPAFDITALVVSK